MKKLICLFLILVLSIGIASISFAETVVTPEPVPGAAPETVDSVMYGNDNLIIPDQGIPGGSVTKVDTETIPAGLPKTGGIPAETFYVAGALFIVAALILSRKKAKV